jgi:hypothetical protein
MVERMTKADELNALADRCERENGGMHLDQAILSALGYTWRGLAYWHRDNSHTWKHSSKLTTSLDAAVSLVPENFSYELAFSAAGEGAMRRARLWDWRRGPLMIDPANEWASTAKTLPMALCAAALRARAALSQTDGAAPETPKVRTPK